MVFKGTKKGGANARKGIIGGNRSLWGKTWCWRFFYDDICM